jgi:hypothetical protein
MEVITKNEINVSNEINISINMKSIMILAFASVATAASAPAYCKQSVPSTISNHSDVYYYYNEYDVSSCAEPIGGVPCIGEMYFTDYPHLEYVPYYVWYKIDKKGVNVWFEYNNTKPVHLGSARCDNKKHSISIDKCDFSETLYDTGVFNNFTFSFDINCNVKGNDVTLFNMNQTTHLNGELVSTFPFAWFMDWTIEDNTPDFNTETFASIVRPIPPPDTPCKYCEKGVVVISKPVFEI